MTTTIDSTNVNGTTTSTNNVPTTPSVGPKNGKERRKARQEQQSVKVDTAMAEIEKLADKFADVESGFDFALAIATDCPVGREQTKIPIRSADGTKSSMGLDYLSGSDVPVVIVKELAARHVAGIDTEVSVSGKRDVENAVQRSKKGMTPLHGAAMLLGLCTRDSVVSYE